MYKFLIRPVLFRFNAETAHNITMGALGILKHIPLARQITRLAFCKDTPELSKEAYPVRAADYKDALLQEDP